MVLLVTAFLRQFTLGLFAIAAFIQLDEDANPFFWMWIVIVAASHPMPFQWKDL
jgi:hypothetical protein